MILYIIAHMMDVTLIVIHYRRLCYTLVTSLTTVYVHRDLSLVILGTRTDVQCSDIVDRCYFLSA